MQQHPVPYKPGNANNRITHGTVQKPCLAGVAVVSHDRVGSKETLLT